MPPYKSFLLLVLILAVCAVSCKPADIPRGEPIKKDNDVSIEFEVKETGMWGITRFHDTKYGIVCYKYAGTAMSCVKL